MSEYAYRPWADDDGSGPLDEMAEGDIEKALGNYVKKGIVSVRKIMSSNHMCFKSTMEEKSFHLVSATKSKVLAVI